MNFTQAIASGFSNYVGFSGRASRSEFWYWVLFTIIGQIVAGILDGLILPELPISLLATVFSLATFLPGLALNFRRLHDIDRTAWWVLIVFTIIGAFVLLYWACCKGTTGANRFGPDPLA